MVKASHIWMLKKVSGSPMKSREQPVQIKKVAEYQVALHGKATACWCFSQK